MKKPTTILLFYCPFACNSVFAQETEKISDKTLVVWVSLDNLSQQGGSALTIDDRHGRFDGIVFGEIEVARWMAGSEGFNRTRKEQTTWPSETHPSGEVRANGHRLPGNNISIYRNGDV